MEDINILLIEQLLDEAVVEIPHDALADRVLITQELNDVFTGRG